MKKLSRFVKNNIVGFILGAVIFSGIGITIAGTVASSLITYTNNGQSTVQGALNDLYNKASELDSWKNGDIAYGYWDDDYLETEYSSTSTPNMVSATTERGGIYDVFIKTLYNNGYPIKHVAVGYKCSGNILYLDHGFWQSIIGSTEESTYNGNIVKEALKTAMENTCGYSPDGCSSSSKYATCADEDADITVYSDGKVYAFDGGSNWCEINSLGVASCH